MFMVMKKNLEKLLEATKRIIKALMFSLLGKGAEDKLDYHMKQALYCLDCLPSQFDTAQLKEIVDLFYNRDH